MKVAIPEPNNNEAGRLTVIKNSVTLDTVNAINSLIRQSRNMVLVRQAAENIIAGVPEKDWRGEVEAVFEYVKRNMRYTKDYPNVEYIKTPERHIRDIQERGLAFGDCDDHAVLLGSLLYSVGYPVSSVIVQVKGTPDGWYNHVYLYVNVPYTNNWISLDATAKDKPMGWECEAVMKKVFSAVGL